jgi:hypothetical protein
VEIGCGGKANLSPLKQKRFCHPVDARIIVNRAQQRRIIVLNHLETAALTNAREGEQLGIFKRQLRRWRKA